jgi:hypothetical protein
LSRSFQRLDGFPSAPSPVPLRVRVHPLMSLTSPSECVLLVTCPTPRCRAPSLGSASPSRQKRLESTQRRVSHTRLRSAHSVSRALDGLLLHTLRGLISSHCHVRDSPFRGFPRCQVGSPHRRVVPSCRYRASPHGELPRRCQFHSLRLQGFDPSSDPLRPTGGLDLPSARSPLRISPPRAYLRLPWRRLHAPSAHDLSRLALAVYLTAGLQRINQQPT